MEVGVCRTGYSTLGFAAVSAADPHVTGFSRKSPAFLLLAMSAAVGVLLPGCTIISTTTGVVTAIATGTATGIRP